MEWPTKGDLYKLIGSSITVKSLVKHNIESFNDFTNHGIKSIITDSFSNIEGTVAFGADEFYKGQKVTKGIFKIRFRDVKLTKPTTMSETGAVIEITPQYARKNNDTYTTAINLNVDIDISFYNGTECVGNVKSEIADAFVGSFPVVVKSDLCALNGVSAADLYDSYLEDPNDPGGYVIVSGTERTLDCVESLAFNIPHVRNSDDGTSTKLEFISKYGDGYENTYQTIIVLDKNGIGIRFPGCQDLLPEHDYIPVQLLYRMAGYTDSQFISAVLGVELEQADLSDKQLKVIYNCLIDRLTKNTKIPNLTRFDENTLLVTDKTRYKPSDLSLVYDPFVIGYELAKATHKIPSSDTTNLSATEVRYVRDYRDLMIKAITNTMLTQVYINAPTIEIEYANKLASLAVLIKKTILVSEGLVEETHRDKYTSKRLHPAGHSFAKAFKTNFNATVVNCIRINLNKIMKNTTDKANINFKDSIAATIRDNSSKLRAALEAGIKNGSGDMIDISPKKKTKNHIYSQTLIRKNPVNTIHTCRVITSPSASVMKTAKSERSIDMRSVQPSYVGYVCPLSTTDTGPKVGLSKQLAVTCGITYTIASAPVIEYATKLINVMNEKYPSLKNLRTVITPVMVNGAIVGHLRSKSKKICSEFLNKFRADRLDGIVNKHVSISMDSGIDTINIWCDSGRCIRPLLRVVNNFDKFMEGKEEFRQHLAISIEEINRISELHPDSIMPELEKVKAIEYIAVDEAENCVLTTNIDHLRTVSGDPTIRYTHCEVEMCVFGFTALTSVAFNHTAPTRASYQTNQAKQTNGLAIMNASHRYDKKKYNQIFSEMPVVTTLANNVVTPNGQNLIVAMMCHGGRNQEDSTIINEATVAADILSLYYYTYESAVVTNSKAENIGKQPDSKRTVSKNCSFLDDRGVIKAGSVIEKDTVLVTKQVIDSAQSAKTLYTTFDGPDDIAEVDGVHTIQASANAIKEVKVRLKSKRRTERGDKFSTRSANKLTVSEIVPAGEMPYLDNGVIPDMIISPLSVPTRMVIGQLIESIYATLGNLEGDNYDLTAFNDVDVETVSQMLQEKYGIDGFSRRKMINGCTGEEISTYVFTCPLYIQRLQKFAIEEAYVAVSGPVDAITRQPVEGRAKSGGLRDGEMEKDCKAAHGTSHALQQTFINAPDKTIMYVCKDCGNHRCVVNSHEQLYKCGICESNTPANIAGVETSSSVIHFFNMLAALGVDTRMDLE